MTLEEFANAAFDHERRKGIEERARKDAEEEKFTPPVVEGNVYQHRLMCEAERLLYIIAHEKRRKRLERIAAKQKGM